MTSSNFSIFSKAVHQQLKSMGSKLYTVDVVDIFDKYLAAFPEGTNPIFRERTEHDCSCCKQFIRNLGTVVSFDGYGNRHTVWDSWSDIPEPYATVGMRLQQLVMQAPITGVYRTKEGGFGAESTVELLDSGDTHVWNHFHGNVPAQCRSQRPDEDRGRINTKAHVFRRGLEELNVADLDTVIDLIKANNLYRGAEHLDAVVGFRKLLKAYDGSDAYVWANIDDRHAAFRNTVIGTMLVDLAESGDIEAAVGRFESKVAPHNYKRPKALITPKMVEQAMETLRDLGLEGAIERRHAALSDVSVNDVLWVNNEAQNKMKDGIEGLLLGEAKRQAKPKSFDKATKISMADFLASVVPSATSIQLALTNKMLGNFASLTAPVGADTGRLFKWDNDFAWSYDGDVADSIEQRVKTAGGNTDAKLRVSLAWSNYDDLDIHADCPDGHIYFGSRQGILDVDMNVGPQTRDPVENLSWIRPKDGLYTITVNQFTRRENKDDGFTIELAHNGTISQFTCPVNPRSKSDHTVLTFEYRKGEIVNLKVGANMAGGDRPGEKWGLTTGQLVPVSTFMRSPNHWDGQSVGNLHWFFILEGAKNPEEVRGIYNEFLRGELDKHRKVFEVLGSKAKAPVSDEQLSGVGFSSTKNESAIFVVNNNRAYEVEFQS